MNNPLMKHFRQAAIHIKLPTNGQYWADEALNLPVTGEIPVYPMTTKDEILLKTPDALMNGSGLVQVLQSCCPNIIDGWECPSLDIDALLISIRIASYGETMDLEASCPQCKEENVYQINLQNILAGIQMPDFNIPIEFEGLQIFLKPQKYFDKNKKNMIEFEEQQLLKLLGQSVDESVNKEELQLQFNKHVENLLELNVNSLCLSTKHIVMGDGQVISNQEHIKELFQNAKGALTKKMQSKISQLAKDASVKPIEVSCNECSTKYSLDFTFDYSHFFV